MGNCEMGKIGKYVSPSHPLYQQHRVVNKKLQLRALLYFFFGSKKPLQSKAKGYRIRPVGSWSGYGPRSIRLAFNNNLRNGEAEARISTYNGMFVVCN